MCHSTYSVFSTSPTLSNVFQLPLWPDQLTNDQQISAIIGNTKTCVCYLQTNNSGFIRLSWHMWQWQYHKHRWTHSSTSKHCDVQLSVCFLFYSSSFLFLSFPLGPVVSHRSASVIMNIVKFCHLLCSNQTRMVWWSTANSPESSTWMCVCVCHCGCLAEQHSQSQQVSHMGLK